MFADVSGIVVKCKRRESLWRMMVQHVQNSLPDLELNRIICECLDRRTERFLSHTIHTYTYIDTYAICQV